MQKNTISDDTSFLELQPRSWIDFSFLRWNVSSTRTMFRNDRLKQNDGDYVKACDQPWDIPCNRSTSSIVLLRPASRYLHIVECCTPSWGSISRSDVRTEERSRESFRSRAREFFSFSFSFVSLVSPGNKTSTTAAGRSYVIGGHDLLPSVTIR